MEEVEEIYFIFSGESTMKTKPKLQTIADIIIIIVFFLLIGLVNDHNLNLIGGWL